MKYHSVKLFQHLIQKTKNEIHLQLTGNIGKNKMGNTNLYLQNESASHFQHTVQYPFQYYPK